MEIDLVDVYKEPIRFVFRTHMKSLSISELIHESSGKQFYLRWEWKVVDAHSNMVEVTAVLEPIPRLIQTFEHGESYVKEEKGSEACALVGSVSPPEREGSNSERS